MEAICSSKMSVDTQWTAQCYIPEVDTLHEQYSVYSIIMKVKEIQNRFWSMLKCGEVQIFGNKSNKSKFDS
jgi:hypothetical protein